MLSKLKIRLFMLMPLLWVVVISSNAQPAGYLYSKQIAIQASEVSGSVDLVNFPVLIRFSTVEGTADPDLLTSSGKVTSTSGFDIVFTESDCNTLLDHQLEYYNGSTGELAVWVRVPLLSTSSNTAIGMFYGNSAVVTDQSSNGTWNSDYLSVFHMGSTFNDQSGGGVTGTDVNASIADTVGIVGRAKKFNGTDSYIQTNLDLSAQDDFTISLWVNANDIVPQHLVWQGEDGINGWGTGAGNDHEFHLSLGTCCGFSATQNDSVSFFMGDREDDVSATVITTEEQFTNTSTWHLLTASIENISTAPTSVLYFDGVAVSTDTGTGGGGSFIDPTQWNTDVRIGSSGNTGTRLYFGAMDEVQISGVAHNSDWILTQFRNQREGSTFYNVSPEIDASLTCSTLPVELKFFEISPIGSRKVKLEWETASETNNDKFIIQRSLKGNEWKDLFEIGGAGNSTEPISYVAIDENPYAGLSYYRLLQVDFDGTSTHSKTKTIVLEAFKNFTVYPIPAKDELTVEVEDPDRYKIEVFNNLRQRQKVNYKIVNQKIIFDVSTLGKGIYYLSLRSGNSVANKKIIIN